MSDQQLPTDINEIDLRAKTFDDLIEHWNLIEARRKVGETVLQITSNPKRVYYLTEGQRAEYKARCDDEVLITTKGLIVMSCDYFGIEPNPDMDMTLCLKLFEAISERVKKRPQGRQTKWGFLEKLTLIEDVEDLLDSGLTVEQACKQLVKDKPSLISSTEDGMQEPYQTLARLYRKFSKELVQSLQDFLSKDHEQPKSNTD